MSDGVMASCQLQPELTIPLADLVNSFILSPPHLGGNLPVAVQIELIKGSAVVLNLVGGNLLEGQNRQVSSFKERDSKIVFNKAKHV